LPIAIVSLIGGLIAGVLMTSAFTSIVHKFHLPELANYIICLFPVLYGILKAKGWGWGLRKNIRFIPSGTSAPRLVFHQFEFAIGLGFTTYLTSIGMFLGIHTQLIYHAGDHCGLTFAPTWWDSFRIASTNGLDGVTLNLTRAIGLRGKCQYIPNTKLGES